MRRTITNHLETGELLLTLRAFQISRRVIFNDTLDQTFHQSPSAAFMVFVEQRLASCAMYRDGANIFIGHSSSPVERVSSSGRLNTVRQRVSRLLRESLAFSKKLTNDIGAITFFVCNDTLEKVAALPV